MDALGNIQYDPIEKLIEEEGLYIKAVNIHPEMDLMIIILNTTATLQQNLSSHKKLEKAPKHSLLQYELIGNGKGIHWPLLNEDLSLKGFLQDELRKIRNPG